MLTTSIPVGYSSNDASVATLRKRCQNIAARNHEGQQTTQEIPKPRMNFVQDLTEQQKRSVTEALSEQK